MKQLLTMLLASAVPAVAADPVIVYTKQFPGSTPAYVAITLKQDGSATYKEAEEEDPESFKIEQDAATTIFLLADTLGRFTQALEAEAKVANMGLKTFRWEEDGNATIVKFNYTTNGDAKTLADWFERITESERILIDLRRTARFDRLGVHEVLVRLESAWNAKRVVGKEQFLTMLDRIAKNESYLHMARERAAALGEAFRSADKGE